MEKGRGTGFVVADKAEVESGVGGGSGLKLQRTQSFPYKMLMMTPHHHRLFSSSESGSGSGGGGAEGGGGPTFYSGSNEVGRCMSDIYDVVGAGSGSGSGSGGALARTLQPFNTSASSFKSPGVMAASLRFPFTTAQWHELERQAMIYKYMMASVPVPPQLLIPIHRNLSDTTASSSNLGRGSCFNLRFSNNTDPEPGRCRRTDGKKWRCSRDVAPDQKYCERHMHRGRPRSRKPVEVHAVNNKTPPILPSKPATLTNLTVNTNGTSSHHLGASKPYHKSTPFLDKSDYPAPYQTLVSDASYKEPRGLNWMMKGETAHVATSNQQWQQLMQSKAGLMTEDTRYDPNASAFNQHYEEVALNLNLYADAQQQNDQTCLFLNPELEELPSSDHSETARRFIDAWSTAGRDETPKTSNKSNGNLPISSLTLSMSGEEIRMGLGITESDDGGGGVKSQPLNWMTHVPWIASPPGGPLAEVLRPSTATTTPGSNEASPRASPSGVLQKTIASLSDSSGCSSPTFTTVAAKQ